MTVLFCAFLLTQTGPTLFHYYYDLDLRYSDNLIWVTPQSRMLGPDGILGDYFHRHSLLEKARGHMFNHFNFIKWEQTMPKQAFRFTYVVENLRGEWLSFNEVDVLVKRDKKALHMYWGEAIKSKSRKGGQYRRFDREALASGQAVPDFLNALPMPGGPPALVAPADEEFVIQLYWVKLKAPPVFKRRKSGPIVLPDTSIRRARVNEPLSGEARLEDAHWELWNHPPPAQKLRQRAAGGWSGDMIHLHPLGSAYCMFRQDADRLKFQSSPYQNYLASVLRKFVAWKYRLPEDVRESMALLKTYLELVPGDGEALAMLIIGYEQLNRHDKALALTNRYSPILYFPFTKEVAARYKKRKEELLAIRDTFTLDPKIDIRFLSPKDDDTVTNVNLLRFAIEGAPTEPLRIECALDGKVFAELDAVPPETRFSTLGLQDRTRLTVTAWYFNKTYSSASIDLNVFHVDEQQELYSTVLRAVAKKGNHLLTDLEKDDFRIRFKGRDLKPANIEKNRKPLRITVLLDNSGSMQGEFIQNAQFAIGTFLNSLEAEDRAELLLFDRIVKRLHGFSNDAESLRASIFGIDPRNSTALYDGLLVAHNDLLEQTGTRVIIVISDGRDTTSRSMYRTVRSRLIDSDVMVYSITLGEDNNLLHSLSNATASVYTNLEKVTNLEETMGRIYEELKAFYTIEVQTAEKPKRNALKVTLNREGKVRTRLLTHH
ncbi:MAG: VWA domain-containing protein [Acidobacteriota bacterium]|nr:VWA domain-containing protein [Acidobacteriota bacterium]